MNMNQEFQQVHLRVSDLMLQQPVLSLEIGLILHMASKMFMKISSLSDYILRNRFILVMWVSFISVT